jgi:hypothetical protein
MTMQTRGKIPIEDKTREALATILDTLLPGTETLPSGRAVGAHLDLLDRVLEADPRLQAAVTKAAELAVGSQTCTIADLERWSGDHLEQVIFSLNSAYYMSSEVRAALGYPGQGRRPVALATPDEMCSDELVAPVLARGDIYVPAPK